MKALIQRVSQAKVEVDGLAISQIGPGLLIFLGITHADTPLQIEALVQKIIHLRIFEDDEGKMNRSLIEKKGEVLIVSQFTLYGDCSNGKRPSFTQAARPDIARPLYDEFVSQMQKTGIPTQTGIFGASMDISLTNHGPITLLLEKVS